MSENKKLGQEPIFPTKRLMVTGQEFSHNINDNGILTTIYKDKTEKVQLEGMSKRFYLASLAMQSLLSNPSIVRPQSFSDIEGYKEFAKVCYSYADSILEQENDE